MSFFYQLVLQVSKKCFPKNKIWHFFAHRLLPDILDPAVEQRGLAQDRGHVSRVADVKEGGRRLLAVVPHAAAASSGVQVGAGSALDIAVGRLVVVDVVVAVAVGNEGGRPRVVQLVQVVLDLLIPPVAPDWKGKKKQEIFIFSQETSL